MKILVWGLINYTVTLWALEEKYNGRNKVFTVFQFFIATILFVIVARSTKKFLRNIVLGVLLVFGMVISALLSPSSWPAFLKVGFTVVIMLIAAGIISKLLASLKNKCHKS